MTLNRVKKNPISHTMDGLDCCCDCWSPSDTGIMQWRRQHLRKRSNNDPPVQVLLRNRFGLLLNHALLGPAWWYQKSGRRRLVVWRGPTLRTTMVLCEHTMVPTKRHSRQQSHHPPKMVSTGTVHNLRYDQHTCFFYTRPYQSMCANSLYCTVCFYAGSYVFLVTADTIKSSGSNSIFFLYINRTSTVVRVPMEHVF